MDEEQEKRAREIEEQEQSREEERQREQQQKQQDKAARKQKRDQRAKFVADKLRNGGKLVTFILTHLPLIIVLGIIIIAIIYAFAIYGFITSMPGMVTGKLREVGKSFWTEVKGFITGDYTYIDSEDVDNLAQYLEDMGYSVQGYGFADVKYKDSSELTTQGKTKQIEKVTGVKYRDNYLHSYLAANEETYQLSKFSIWGTLQATGAGLSDTIKAYLGLANIEVNSDAYDYHTYSTGLIQADGLVNFYIGDISIGKMQLEDLVKVNRDTESMDIYSYTTKAFLPWLPNIRFGTKFNYDLSDWTAKYGRPTEMFIALHLATGMPDLTNEIATSNDFNTKVHIQTQDVTMLLGDKTQLDITAPNGNKLSKQKIERAYFKYILDCVKEHYDDYGTPALESQIEAKNAWWQIYNTMNTTYQSGNSVVISNFLSRYFDNAGLLGGYIKEAYNATYNASIDEDLLVLKLSGSESHYLSGVTDDQLMELVGLIDSAKKGIQHIHLPYISEVTRHWFYQTINFTVGVNGVYQASEYAWKTIGYEPRDNSKLADFEITFKHALLHDETGKGILFQVNEPDVRGPNKNIIDLFQNEYYKYDGTIETAHNIAKTILVTEEGKNAGYEYIFNGEINTLEGKDVTDANAGNLAKKEKPSFGTATDTLSAFNILKNVNTLEAETSYRCLKELATNENIEGHMEKEALTEELKQVLIWAFDDKNGNGKWNVSKTQDDYGITITGAAGQTMVAPGDCTAKVEGGKLILTFRKLSSNKNKANPGTVQILKKKYSSKDFYKVEQGTVYQMQMIIEGINVSGSSYYSRGQKIGTANAKVKITMKHVDKSLVGSSGKTYTIDDDVEEYMNQTYTNYDENQIRKAITEAHNTATGGSSTTYIWDDDDTASGSTEYNRAIIDSNKLALIGGNADGTFVYNGNTYDTMQLIYAIVAAECNNSVDGAWAVITSAYNRLGKQSFSSRGTTLIEQLTSPSQYAVSSALSNWYGKTIPQAVIEGVNKLVDGRQKNHGFDSFKTYGVVGGTDWKKWVEDQIIATNNCNISDLPRFCRNIGGNYYHNGDFSPEQ